MFSVSGMKSSEIFEVNFDGIVGPTHNYAGLSYGNIASQKHGNTTANPKQAALQGLAKMKFLADLGVAQAVLPPQERPAVGFLRRLGFQGDDAAVLAGAGHESPALLVTACSASCMWAANAATVSPSADTDDRRVHFTAANLISQPHRAIEAGSTAAVLRAIFNDDSAFAHHTPLPASAHLGDEGAANHTRLGGHEHGPGIELFVYGRSAFDTAAPGPQVYPARQTREASTAIARLHRLDPKRTVFAQQNPAAIDAGVFHNDVIAVGHHNVLLYHREAFLPPDAVLEELRGKFAATCGRPLIGIEVTREQVFLADAVKTYLFNSQLVTLPDGAMTLVCPQECGEHQAVARLLDEIVASENPIGSVRFVDVRQSMNNGGGPACLRLRVLLTADEIRLAHQGVFLSDELYHRLVAWVEKHYRDQLNLADLADPQLLEESRTALDELSEILELGAIYPFQSDVGVSKY